MVFDCHKPGRTIASPLITPDWTTALNDCLALRPGLALARQDLKFRQLDLINEKNLLLPDLRFTSTYAPNGLGSTLDGALDDVRDRFGSAAVTRAVLLCRDPGLSVPLLPD